MHFETHFTVSGSPLTVIEQLADVPLMASFLPGASVEEPGVDGSYPATLVASFGPKKIGFKGTLTNRVDHETLSGVLVGQASADVRGARMAVTMTYRLAAVSGISKQPKTEVTLTSDAQLSGVLAEFAKAGGVIVAEAMIADFARRFSAHSEALAQGQTLMPAEQASTLSFMTVAGAMARKLRHWIRRKVFRAASA